MSSEHDTQNQQIVDALLRSYAQKGELGSLRKGTLPNREVIWRIAEDLLRILFPGVLEQSAPLAEDLEGWTRARIASVRIHLMGEIAKDIALCREGVRPNPEQLDRADAIARDFLSTLPAVREFIALDAAEALEGDPAARSITEIIVAYQGLQAIAVFRMAHILYLAGAHLVARVMAEFAHSRTGIDIHPGARIGQSFFIDHGTGVVIGETSTIGDHVKIYQGVTLGAKSFVTDADGQIVKGVKRHPNIEDHVTIYAGATILGNITIGKGSVIGGNAWVTRSVSPNTKVAVRPPQQVQSDDDIEHYYI